jgi:hypothetical protein
MSPDREVMSWKRLDSPRDQPAGPQEPDTSHIGGRGGKTECDDEPFSGGGIADADRKEVVEHNNFERSVGDQPAQDVGRMDCRPCGFQRNGRRAKKGHLSDRIRFRYCRRWVERGLEQSRTGKIEVPGAGPDRACTKKGLACKPTHHLGVAKIPRRDALHEDVARRGESRGQQSFAIGLGEFIVSFDLIRQKVQPDHYEVHIGDRDRSGRCRNGPQAQCAEECPHGASLYSLLCHNIGKRDASVNEARHIHWQ